MNLKGYGVNNGKSLYTNPSNTLVMLKKLASKAGSAGGAPNMVPDSPRGNMLEILRGPELAYSMVCA